MIKTFLYNTFSILGILSAFLKILSSQPITRLALLIMIFIKSAFLFLLLDYYFLGLTYIIVYVGAIAILFLFVIMMAETHLTPLMNSNNKGISDSPVIKSTIMQASSNSYILRIPTTKDNYNINYNHPTSYSQTLNFTYNHSIFLGTTLVIILLT
jgi:NADH:ubiquinone oxidoreductase subunit 6 (subunit J)